MTTAAPTFKIALVQMRSGVHPDANLAAALAAIDEAARAGAAYVLTPEMTNIMEVKRERLFATITDEDPDPTLAALRAAARGAAMFVHGGLRCLFIPCRWRSSSPPTGRLTVRS